MIYNLPNLRSNKLVNNPISLGTVPVKSLLALNQKCKLNKKEKRCLRTRSDLYLISCLFAKCFNLHFKLSITYTK